MKLQRLGVFLLGVSLAIFGSMVPARAAGSITVWVNSGEEAAYKAASAACRRSARRKPRRAP